MSRSSVGDVQHLLQTLHEHQQLQLSRHINTACMHAGRDKQQA
jgi:hypothetical protein